MSTPMTPDPSTSQSSLIVPSGEVKDGGRGVGVPKGETDVDGNYSTRVGNSSRRKGIRRSPIRSYTTDVSQSVLTQFGLSGPSSESNRR